MRKLILLTASATLLLSVNAMAGPTDPLTCFCEFEGVLFDGMGLVDATDCQVSQETSHTRERQERGAYTEILSFVGGMGQACGTMQVRKFKDGHSNRFSCTAWVQESRSNDVADCEVIRPRNRPVDHLVISRRNMRACEQLLDQMADEVFALPDCSAP